MKLQACIGLLLALVILVEVVQTEPNTFVLHVDSKFTTESRWLATFTLQVTPYLKHLQEFDDTLKGLQSNINHYITQYRRNGSNQYIPLFQLRQKQAYGCATRILNLRARITDVQKSFPSTHVSRDKRSLLPFIGNVLSSITGTATENDIKMINDKLAQLDSQSIALKHIMKDSLSIVNATQIKTVQLTHTVNHLITEMSLIYDSLDNVTSMTFDELRRAEVFTSVWDQIDIHVTNLQRGLDIIEHEIDLFEQKIADVISFKVTPTLIAPRELKVLLIEVDKSLDKVELPYDINNQLMLYYQYLSSSMFATEHGLGVVISIPLISPHSKVDIYQIVNYPIPYSNNKLLLNHAIDHKYLAVNPSKTEIAYLNEHEFIMCTKPNVVNCHINSPFRFITSINQSCAATLVTSASIKDCPVILQPNDLVLPLAHSMQHGKWIIVTPNDISFTIICPRLDTVRHFTVKAPVDFILLSLGCYAQSLSLLLPPTYHRPSHIVYHPITEFVKDNITIDSYVPALVHHYARTKPHQLIKMVDHTISIDDLHRRLDDLADVPLTRFHQNYLPVVILTCLLVTALGMWFAHRVLRPRCHRFRSSSVVETPVVTPVPPPTPIIARPIVTVSN